MPIDYVNHGAQEVIVITSGEARGVIPLLDQLVVEQDTGKLQVGNGSASIADLPYVPSPGGGGDSLPIADPTGPPTSGTADNTIKGDGTYAWVKFPAETTVAAWGIEGDDFPRVVFGADPTDWGVILIGDGTFDPANGATIGLRGNGQLYLGGHSAGVRLQGGDTEVRGNLQMPVGHVVFAADGGAVLVSPDATQHRIVVADDGTLSTVAFP